MTNLSPQSAALTQDSLDGIKRHAKYASDQGQDFGRELLALLAAYDAQTKELAALRAPVGDEEVARRILLLRTRWPVAQQDHVSADIIERLARLARLARERDAQSRRIAEQDERIEWLVGQHKFTCESEKYQAEHRFATEKRAEAAERDAARYRMLRDSEQFAIDYFDGNGPARPVWSGDRLDAATDAALALAREAEGGGRG